jgi:hypothetical protein
MSLPSLDSFLVSETFAIDVMSERLSFFNLIHALFLPALPALWPKFVAIATYEAAAEPAAFYDRVVVYSPNGAVLNESEHQIEMTARLPGDPVKIHRSIHVVWRTKLTEPGDLQIVLERRSDPDSAWEELHRKRISIVVGPHSLHGPGSAPVAPQK